MLEKCVDLFGERVVFSVGTWISLFSVVSFFNVWFGVSDYWRLNQKNRIQGTKYPEKSLILTALKNQIVDNMLVPVFAFLGYDLFKYFGLSLALPLPSLSQFLWHFLISAAVDDTLFYWLHYLLHHPKLYWIHKQHHQFEITIAIASQYAHPIEAFLANMLPTVLGPLLLGTHAVTFWLILILKLWQTIEAHSGYVVFFSPWSLFPFMGGSQHHEYHHSHFRGNYGGYTRFWDYVMGTDMTHKETLPTQRNTKKNH